MKRLFSIAFSALISTVLSAQALPPINCGDAESVCDSIVTVDTIKVPANTGGNEISNNSCLPFGEVRGTWYKFGVTGTGNLRFLITPLDTTTDFDWALFRTDWAPCTDIFGIPEYEVSCNASGIGGGFYTTGATGLVQQGHSPAINVTTPALFYLYVTTATYDTNDVLGYTLDFSASDFELVGCGEIGIEQEGSIHVKTYPNPFDGFITIDAPGGSGVEIELYDISGRNVVKYEPYGASPYYLSTDHLPAGIYTLVVRSDQGVASRKVVKY